MDFNTRVENGCTIVSLRGRLDTATAPDCDRRFRELVADNVRVIVDFEGLDYISSAGLRSVLFMTTLVKEKNGRICLANAQDNVRTAFGISGFDGMFDIRDSLEEAIAAVHE